MRPISRDNKRPKRLDLSFASLWRICQQMRPRLWVWLRERRAEEIGALHEHVRRAVGVARPGFYFGACSIGCGGPISGSLVIGITSFKGAKGGDVFHDPIKPTFLIS